MQVLHHSLAHSHLGVWVSAVSAWITANNEDKDGDGKHCERTVSA